MNENKNQLTSISSILLKEEVSHGEIFQALKDYKSLLMLATNLDFDTIDSEQNIYTESGKAIGPKWASLCVDDILRTQKFCKGLVKAVYRKKQEHPSKRIHILYAGTGPFATLALPLTTCFTEEEITFTFLEINELSSNALKETIAFFQIEGYVSFIEQVDATTYSLKEKEEIDIVIVEAMMFSLKGEHQVPISYNLINQLSEDVILIPQEINLNLVAVNSERRHANKLSLDAAIPYCKRLATLFQLNKTEIKNTAVPFFEKFPLYEFPETKVEIPLNINQNFNELHIETEIIIFEDEVLQIDESGLTVLDKFHEFKSMMSPSRYIVSKYMCGQQPGLYFRFEN